MGLLLAARLRLRRPVVLRPPHGQGDGQRLLAPVEANGKDPNPYRLAFLQFIGVADTDQEAYRLYREPAEYFFNRSLHVYPGYADPPGYVTEASARARYQSQVRAVARAKQAKHDLTWDEMVEKGYVVIGSPDTVRETLDDVAMTFNCGHLLTMLQFGNMSDELTRYNSELFGDKVAPGLRSCSPTPRTTGGRRTPRDGEWPAISDRSTSAGSPGTRRPRPRWRSLEDAGWDIVVPELPGFDGRSGFRPPDDHLGWLTVAWDALDATGALPCPVVGASVGGMLATDLAVFRPEAVTALALLAPFGICDDRSPGLDLFAVPAAERMSHLFAKGVPEPFVERFGHLGPDDGPVARYLSDVAAASMIWPLGDRGQAPGCTASAARRWRCGATRTSCSRCHVGGVGRRWGAGRGHRRRRPSARMGRPGRGGRPARGVSRPRGFSMGLVDEAEFHFFHFFPYTDLPAGPSGVRVPLGRLLQLQLRPEGRSRAVPALPVGDGARRRSSASTG